MDAKALKKKIESLGQGTTAQVTDLTGTQNHWQAVVSSPVFEGKLMIDQHRMIFDLLKDEIASNEVHALTLKTFTPEKKEN